MEAEIIDKFTPELILTISDCIRSVADHCLANGLINHPTYTSILMSTGINEDKARSLIMAVRKRTEVDKYASFEIFLDILNEELSESSSKAELLPAMRAELTKKQAMALVRASSTDQGPVMSVNQGQLTLSVQHTPDISRLLAKEQSPLIGKLEDSTMQLAFTISKKNQLQKELEEKGRKTARVAEVGHGQLLSSVGENDLDTSSPLSEVQIKEKIKELEKELVDLDMEVKRNRRSIHIKGKQVIQGLTSVAEFMMQRKRAERSYYDSEEELDNAEPFSEQIKTERKRERSYYDSEEESDNAKPFSEQIKAESGDEIEEDHDSLPDTQPSLKKILAELNAHDDDDKWNVERNWFDIGIQLDVPASNLQYIRRANHDEGPMGAHHDDRSFRDMLAESLEQKKPSPTWLSLVNAFKLSNCSKFADRLRSKYCPSSESQVCIQKEPQNGDRSHFSSQEEPQDGGGSQVSIATQEEAQNGGGPQLSTQELENDSGSKDGSESWVSTQEEPQNYGSSEITLTQGPGHTLSGSQVCIQEEPQNGDESHTSSQEEPQNGGGSEASSQMSRIVIGMSRVRGRGRGRIRASTGNPGHTSPQNYRSPGQILATQDDSWD